MLENLYPFHRKEPSDVKLPSVYTRTLPQNKRVRTARGVLADIIYGKSSWDDAPRDYRD